VTGLFGPCESKGPLPSRIAPEPLTFLEKLAALVPPPRAHLVTSHGVLALGLGLVGGTSLDG